MDPVSDMLIRLKNAQKAGLDSAQIPYSQFRHEIAKALERARMIKSIEKKGKRIRKILEVCLNKESDAKKIKEVVLLSKPSRRLYVKCKDVGKNASGHELLLISTSKGVMSGQEAKAAGLGGQLIAKIY